MGKKTCTKCKIKYSATKEYFKKDSTKSDGWYSSCKKCVSAAIRKNLYEKEPKKVKNQISKAAYYRLTDGNRLSIANSKLAMEWNYKKNHPLTPDYISVGSDKKVWWKCINCQGEWTTWVYARKHGNGCPYCQGKKVWKKNCLSTTHPKIAKEWHPTKNGELTPEDLTKGTPRQPWWKCSKGHEWRASVGVRTSQNTGCPYCNSSRLSKDNNLAAQFPHLVKEWHPTKNGQLTPFDVTSMTNKSVWWVCLKGHEWKTRVAHRSKAVSNCPYCSKVPLKDGAFCDSLSEAFWYLKFKSEGKRFKFRQLYGNGMGKSKYDFYFPNSNQYVEVTSYGPEWKHWDKYLAGINRKKKYVIKVLNAKFKFIRYVLTDNDRKYVQKHIKQS